MVKRRWLDFLTEAGKCIAMLVFLGVIAGFLIKCYIKWENTAAMACDTAKECKQNTTDIAEIKPLMKKIDNNVERLLNLHIKP